MDGNADTAAPSLNLTPEEKRVFGQLFRQADTDNLGVVTGEVAVKFFEKTRLEPRILGEIWQIADKENRGLLTPAGFGIVLRLIGHYQAGQEPTQELAFRPGPLPKFEGGLPGGQPIQPPPGPPPGALQPQASGSGPIRVPPLTPDKVSQYAALFEKSGAQNGILPGEQAKQIFERAGLPNEVLGRIWNLSDTEQRGALVVTEFVIAMHLLASFKSGALRALPNVLPAGLYEAAARRTPSRQMSGAPAISAIPRQFSGAGAGRAGSPLNRSSYGTPPIQAQMSGQGSDWAITPIDKSNFDNIFTGLDKSNRGFITGDEAVPFFSNSKLPEEVLAQIWDLADINSQGHLTKDEFAVAMFLIRQQRGKRDGRDSLPSTLPANLIPPSMRNQARQPTQPTAPTFDTAPSMPKSAADDLFGLDALSSPPIPAAAPQVPLSTGGSAGYGDPFGNARSPIVPSSPTSDSPQHSTSFKPFAPSSSFGKTLTYNPTGGSNSSGFSPQVTGFQPQQQHTPQSRGMDDLLGDNDPEISRKLTSETSELANLSNQVGSLSKQMQEVQGQRVTSQNELNQATLQKQEFETRLAQLRSLYEQEVKDVRALQESLTLSRKDTQRIQQEMAMIEGSYQDLQNQHRQVVTALQADQQENAALKERMRLLNGEIAQMKPQLEKLKSEARQQKGLVAINKKQLLTNEGEREKLKTETEELAKSNEEHSRAIASASASQVHSPAAIASPALSTMSATNPFFRHQSVSSGEAVFSPFDHSPTPTRQSGQQNFDNMFGPSFAAATPTNQSTLPATTFRSDSPSNAGLAAGAAAAGVAGVAGGVALAHRTTSPAPASSPSASSREVSEANYPPPPSVSIQISSSFLPFPEQDTNSLTSSRQVSAPNSRFGEDPTGAETPTNFTSMTPTGSSVAGHIDTLAPNINRNASASPSTSDAHSTSNTTSAIPGAFPGDPNLEIRATPTGGSNLSEKAPRSASDDPFGTGKELPRAPTAAKDDFDSAFAGFGNSSKPQERQNTGISSSDGSAKGSGNVNTEFPPLQVNEDDDESDSESEGGFDDDFTSASPGHSRKESAIQSPAASTAAPAPASGANPTGFLGTNLIPGSSIPNNASALSLGENPPTPNAQASPPAYERTISPHETAQAEADSYAGLLPSREDPISPGESPQQTFHSLPVTSGHTLFEENTMAPPIAVPAPPAKVPFDDFDNEFDDLEDAKEGDGEDDFANISAHDRSGLDDFNPMFDSPAASKESHHTAHGSSNFGGDSNGFGDFTESPTASKILPAPPAKVTADDHDWDAIFSGLDAPSTEATNAAADLGDDITPAPSPVTALGNGSASTAAPVKEMPILGRALTETGVHDDPILKNLTGMGYPRKEALAALEKYNYNLERAANYLASES